MKSQRPMPAPATPLNPEDRIPRQFISFFFFKVDNAFRHLSNEQQAQAREEYSAVVQKYQQNGTIVVPYSTIGVKSNCDFFLWRIDYKLETLQQMQAELNRTVLGKYTTPVYSLLSMSKKSVYVDKLNPEHDDVRSQIRPGRSKYVFVYPFVKTREWYLLHPPVRQGIMDEHIYVGNKYPTVKVNTTYSFGLDDQDFVVAFEGDYPEDFLDLVMELRETESSKYTERDTPFYTGVMGKIEDVLETL
ncbi:MAG TPA: chlorite dismutase family protein [Abditibacterium sp.]|jgi:chlorite dismutase